MAKFRLYKPNIQLHWRPETKVELHASASRNGVIVRTPNWLGDTIMALPAVHQLRKIIPDDQSLSVTCPMTLTPVWQAVDWVDNIIPLAKRRLSADSRQRLRNLQPAAAVVLPNSFGSAWDLCRLGISVRVGRVGRGRRLLLTHHVPRWRRVFRLDDYHQLSHYLEVVSLLGTVETKMEDTPELHAELSTERFHRLLPRDSGHRTLVLAPGAAYGPAKQWPVEYFHEVARRWNETGGRVCVVGTTGEKPLGEAVLRGIYDGSNLCGQTDLHDLMGILQHACYCVANDSGVMHLAAALGTDGAALFGSTNPLATGPLGPGRWIVLCDRGDCGGPCFARRCPGRGDTPYGCLKRLRPNMVWEALTYLIGLKQVDRTGNKLPA